MRTVVSALMLAALVSGCSIPGKAVEAHFWDPCTELSDQALREAGAKPETKDDAVKLKGWHVCGWQTTYDTYRLNVASSEDSLATLRKRAAYADFRVVEVGGRSGQTYLVAGDRNGGCTVGFDSARGSVHVEMTRRKAGDAACQVALVVARKLLPNLPS
ncbi:DUF3558 domain-containing protein [Smaragdicoccus niigatensis]